MATTATKTVEITVSQTAAMNELPEYSDVRLYRCGPGWDSTYGVTPDLSPRRRHG